MAHRESEQLVAQEASPRDRRAAACPSRVHRNNGRKSARHPCDASLHPLSRVLRAGQARRFPRERRGTRVRSIRGRAAPTPGGSQSTFEPDLPRAMHRLPQARASPHPALEHQRASGWWWFYLHRSAREGHTRLETEAKKSRCERRQPSRTASIIHGRSRRTRPRRAKRFRRCEPAREPHVPRRCTPSSDAMRASVIGKFKVYRAARSAGVFDARRSNPPSGTLLRSAAKELHSEALRSSTRQRCL